jgi:phosphatidylethanolamine-binding protein (PEBP) family uncharacterized protein
MMPPVLTSAFAVPNFDPATKPREQTASRGCFQNENTSRLQGVKKAPDHTKLLWVVIKDPCAPNQIKKT